MSKILITYPVGAYGSFIYWMLTTEQNKHSIDNAPFKKTPAGSSHQFDSIFSMVETRENLQEYLDSPESLIRHTHINENTGLDIAINHSKIKLVYLDVSLDSKIWVMNNQHFKITKNGLFDNYSFIKFLTKWGMRRLDQYESWELREALSHFIVHLDAPGNILASLVNNNSRADVGLYVDIKGLRDAFEDTLDKIYNYCGVNYNKEFVQQVKDQWLETQIHKFKDNLVNDICTKIINNVDFTITDQLSIVDEAYIQHNLRTSGIELRCYNLNTFPKTNKEFQDLIFRNYNTLVENKFNYMLDKVYNKQLSINNALNEIKLIFKDIE